MDVSSRKAISTALVAVIVVLVVAVAAGGIYLATMPSGTSTSTGQQTATTGATTTSASSASSASSTPLTSTTAPPTTVTSTSTAVTQSTAPTTASTASTATTYTCSTTYTSGTYTGLSFTVQAVIPFFQAMSAMSVSYNGTSSGSSYNFTDSYNIVYASTSSGVTTYKVNINLNSSGSVQTATAWVQSNGNVIAVYTSGYNATGSTAQSILVGLMAPFTVETSFAGYIGIYTSGYFHATGTSTQSFGPTSMMVTTYAANSLPLSFTQCGYTATLSEFSLSVGTVPGTSLSLVTHIHINGSASGNSYDFTLKVLSITKA